jgi:hypothetical protein
MWFSGMDIEAAVAPTHQLFDEFLADFTSAFEHGQDLGAEGLPILPDLFWAGNRRFRLTEQPIGEDGEGH